MKLTYPAQFCRDEQGNGYLAVVPDLPGCSCWGDNLADTILLATDTASGWVLNRLEGGYPLPKATPFDKIEPKSGSLVSFLVLDMDAYAERFGEKAVRKNLTIPAWLNTFAEKNGINFSQVLQEALTALYEKKNPGRQTPHLVEKPPSPNH